MSEDQKDSSSGHAVVEREIANFADARKRKKKIRRCECTWANTRAREAYDVSPSA